MPGEPTVDSWVAAVHQLADDYSPLGTALVIDNRRVLTAAHVVTRNGIPLEELWIAFPKSDEAHGQRRRVSEVTVAQPSQIADLALLALDDDIPVGVHPAPIRCPRPMDLVGKKWWAFGFPNADPWGDFAEGEVNSSLGYGWVRLDTRSQPPLARGFSGGGVWSHDYEAVVGIVGQANADGGGRAITLHQADLCFPEEKIRSLAEKWATEQAGEVALAAWGWTLEADPEGVRHWRPRARGVSVESERGYRFRGRTAALTEIVKWLDSENPHRQALVVTGSPGVGKSAVLGRIVTTADAQLRNALPSQDDAVCASIGSVACAVHAKGKTALDVAREIARAASAPLPEYVEDLAPAINAVLSDSRRRFNVIIDALDETISPSETRTIITRIVLPLVETCADLGAQVVVGSRPRDDEGDILRSFGGSAKVIDLDTSEYFSGSDLSAYAMATLQLVGDERPENPYHEDRVAFPVAERIAELSDRNFLVAGLVARTHGLHDQRPVDVPTLAFTASVDQALRAYLERLQPLGPISAESALTVLAFAEAPGFTVDLWLQAIKALTAEEIAPQLLTRFARSSAANFLVESAEEGRTGVYRLFHQALNDSLLSTRLDHSPRGADEGELTKIFRAIGMEHGWASAPSYLLRSLPAHAARARQIDELLADDQFLLHADLRRLIPLADLAVTTLGRKRARLLQMTPFAVSASTELRASLFGVTEALEKLGSVYMELSKTGQYYAMWASTAPRTERAVLEGHIGGVNSLCAITLSQDRTLLATGDDGGVIRLWDPEIGERYRTLTDVDNPVDAMCSVPLNDSTSLLATTRANTVNFWEPNTGAFMFYVIHSHRGNLVTAVCTLKSLIENRTVLATADIRTVILWDPESGDSLLEYRHKRRITTICAIPSQTRDAIAIADSASILLWYVSGEDVEAPPQVRHVSSDRATAIASILLSDSRTLLAIAVRGKIKIWDADSGFICEIDMSAGDIVTWMCTVTFEDGSVLLAAATDRIVSLWDPVTGTFQGSLESDTGRVTGMCAVPIHDGRVLLATGSDDSIVRLWDVNTPGRAEIRDTYIKKVDSICFLMADGQRRVAALIGETITIWNSFDGARLEFAPYSTALCAACIPGNQEALVTSYGGSITLWDIPSGSVINRWRVDDADIRLMRPIPGEEGDSLLAVASTENVSTWNLATGELKSVLQENMGRVTAMCTIRLSDGRTLLATAGDWCTVRVWDPETGALQRTWRGAPVGEIYSLATVRVDGGETPLLAIATDECILYLWNPVSGEDFQEYCMEDETYAMCCVPREGDNDLLAMVGHARVVSIYDPVAGERYCSIPVHHPGYALSWTGDALIVGLSAGILQIGLKV
ncbi:trypsin-like peptidase domain-containing protein [Microbispora sp. H10836]|uniref:trypsin-like peptidase domain-containing protein n=1 Tax=Microbispora sp. H10836 TaxID=2729106 RepID=UPI001475E89D|nr:trypsin-like peptidase domain-containing protein [Microbispora sp. H10836]